VWCRCLCNLYAIATLRPNPIPGTLPCMKRPLPDPREAMRILSSCKTKKAWGGAPRVSKSLKAILKPLDDRFGPGVGALEAHWAAIVGETLSQRTRPIKLSKGGRGGGTLDLAAPGPVAALVQHQIPTIIARANSFLGAGAVGKVRIIQHIDARPQRVKPATGPRDAGVEAVLDAQFQSIADPKLKAAMIRLERATARKP